MTTFRFLFLPLLEILGTSDKLKELVPKSRLAGLAFCTSNKLLLRPSGPPTAAMFLFLFCEIFVAYFWQCLQKQNIRIWKFSNVFFFSGKICTRMTSQKLKKKTITRLIELSKAGRIVYFLILKVGIDQFIFI